MGLEPMELAVYNHFRTQALTGIECGSHTQKASVLPLSHLLNHFSCFIFSLLGWFGGHNWQYSGTTPGYVSGNYIEYGTLNWSHCGGRGLGHVAVLRGPYGVSGIEHGSTT